MVSYSDGFPKHLNIMAVKQHAANTSVHNYLDVWDNEQFDTTLFWWEFNYVMDIP